VPLYQAVVLGVVQGLTEFLPISSTAHLALFPWLAGWKDPGLTFDVAVHAGTLVAVVGYFFRTWLSLLRAGLTFREVSQGTNHYRPSLFWYLVLATLPAAVAGYFGESYAEHAFRRPIIIASGLIVVGLLMGWAEKVARLGKRLAETGLGDAATVGVAQAFAIIPGVSRSGATMTAGLFRGMERPTAARYSFLLSAPIIAGAALKEGFDLYRAGIPADMRLPFAIGVGASMISGYVVIAFLMRYLQTHTLKIFIYYRVIFGTLILLLALLHARMVT
jgi:undecaprenyl-diphosphatase